MVQSSLLSRPQLKVALTGSHSTGRHLNNASTHTGEASPVMFGRYMCNHLMDYSPLIIPFSIPRVHANLSHTCGLTIAPLCHAVLHQEACYTIVS